MGPDCSQHGGRNQRGGFCPFNMQSFGKMQYSHPPEATFKPVPASGLFFYQEQNIEYPSSGQKMLSLVSCPHCSLFPEDC